MFPLQPCGKRPAIRDWPNRASCDTDQLDEWWGRAPYNIGIACGPAGLLVVDLDRRPEAAECSTGAVEGAGLLALLANRAGAGDPLETYSVATPRGEHRYFAVPAVDSRSPADGSEDYRRRVRLSGRTTAGALGPGVDTRAGGGYVAAAGSVGLINGRRHYYRAIRASAVAPAPQWLLDALTPAASTGSHDDPIARPDAYALSALSRETAAVRTAERGTRNGRLFGAAVRLGQLAAAGLMTEHDVTTALLQAADRHVGVEGFTHAEAARAVSNGLAYGRRRPRRVGGADR